MALQAIGHTDDAAFRDSGMRCDCLLDGSRAEAMSSHVDDVVAAGHDVHVAFVVNHPGVAGIDPAAVEALHVALVEAFFVVEEGGEACGCERDGEDDIAHGAWGNFAAGVVDGADVEARHGLTCRARPDGERGCGFVAGETFACVGAESNAGDGGAYMMKFLANGFFQSYHRLLAKGFFTRFGTPPVIDYLSVGSAIPLQEILIHAHNAGLAAFASKEERTEVLELSFLTSRGEKLVVGIVSPDRS